MPSLYSLRIQFVIVLFKLTFILSFRGTDSISFIHFHYMVVKCLVSCKVLIKYTVFNIERMVSGGAVFANTIATYKANKICRFII